MNFQALWIRVRGALTAALLLVSPAVAAGPATAGEPAPAGFVESTPIIPEIGLWVDGSARIGFAKKSGVVLWWGLEPPAAARSSAEPDWRRVTFRIRAEAFRPDGKRAAKEETLVEPLYSDGASEGGGFPTPLHLVLSPGTYRLQLEAYPLISAHSAGLDTVPRGIAEVTMSVPEMNVGSHGWRVSDIILFDSVRKWEPGAAGERTWYDWVCRPVVSRTFAADTLTAYAGFEVLRGSEVVPRCAPGRCRILITVRDAQDGVVLQEVRPVPESASLQAYVLPFRPGELGPGVYSVQVEVFEGAEQQAVSRRPFRVRSNP